jgi:hypothetical protein
VRKDEREVFRIRFTAVARRAVAAHAVRGSRRGGAGAAGAPPGRGARALKSKKLLFPSFRVTCSFLG